MQLHESSILYHEDIEHFITLLRASFKKTHVRGNKSKWISEQTKPDTSLVAKTPTWKLSYFRYVMGTQGSPENSHYWGPQKASGKRTTKHQMDGPHRSSPRLGLQELRRAG